MNEQPTLVHRKHRSRSRASDPGRVWREYRFEIVWLVVVAAGLFLLFEQISIRLMLRGWLQRLIAELPRRAAQVNAALGSFFAQASLSDLLGYALIVSAVVAIVGRLRWRLQRSPSLTELCCPKCGGNVHRKHRTLPDRLLSLLVPVHRYRCVNYECHWQGLRVVPARGAPQFGPAREVRTH